MSLTNILDEHEIPYKPGGQHHHVRHGWIGVDCPWCGESGGYHLGINLGHGYASCWQCGYHDLTDALAMLLDQPRNMVRRTLVGIVPISLTKLPEMKGHLEYPLGVMSGRMGDPASGPHWNYLAERGLDPDTMVRLWDVGTIGLHPRLSWRLFIPIHHRGRVVSWTTRAIGKVQKRYISAKPDEEAVHHKRLLYGADYARHAIIVVEGPLDVWRIGPGAVATMGLSYTPAQLRAAAEYPVRAVCFDREPAAQRVAERLCSELSAFPGQTHLVTLDADDPGEAGEEEIRELRKRFLGDD